MTDLHLLVIYMLDVCADDVYMSVAFSLRKWVPRHAAGMLILLKSTHQSACDEELHVMMSGNGQITSCMEPDRQPASRFNS
jgi:hypothetical protein